MRVATPLINPASQATGLTFPLIARNKRKAVSKKKEVRGETSKTPLAEKEGFEPPRRFHDLAIFKTVLLSHLSTSPT